MITKLGLTFLTLGMTPLVLVAAGCGGDDDGGTNRPPERPGEILWERSLGNSLFADDVGGEDDKWLPGAYVVPAYIEDLARSPEGGLFTATPGTEPQYAANARFDEAWQRDGFYWPTGIDGLIFDIGAVAVNGERVFLGQARRIDWQSDEQTHTNPGGLYVMGADPREPIETQLANLSITALATHGEALYVADETAQRVRILSFDDLTVEQGGFAMPDVVTKISVDDAGILWILRGRNDELQPAASFGTPFVSALTAAGVVQLATLDLDGEPGAVCTHGDRLYVGLAPRRSPGRFGIEVFDISDVTAPVPVRRIENPRFGRILDLECTDDRLVALVRDQPLWNEPVSLVVEMDLDGATTRELFSSFVDSTVAHPTDPARRFTATNLWELDFDVAGQGFQELVGSTLDVLAYPEDLRAVNTFIGLYVCPAASLEHDGDGFVAMGLQSQSVGSLYAIDDATTTLTPVAAWNGEHTPTDGPITWPREAPVDSEGLTRWNYWNDLDGDGQMDGAELAVWDENTGAVGEDWTARVTFVDKTGALWATADESEINRFYVYDLAWEDGAPRIPSAATQAIDLGDAAIEGGRINGDFAIASYDEVADELAVITWTLAHPILAVEDPIGLSYPKGLVLYRGVRRGTPERVWEAVVPFRDAAFHGDDDLATNPAYLGAGVDADVDLQGNYVFVTFNYGLVVAYDRATGASLSRILPLNHQNAKVDCVHGAVQIEQPSADTYRIFQESVYTSSVNVVEWRAPAAVAD